MVASSTSPLRPELAKLVSGRAWRTRRFGAWAALITGAWLVLEFTIVELALFGTPSLAQSSSQDPAVVGTTLGLALVWGVALWTLGRSGASVNGYGLRVVWGWRTRGVSWADVEGFVPNLGGNPGLWLQTAPKTFPLPSPLHQLSPATSEECALRLNQALGIDPAVSRSGTWTGVEVGVVVPPDRTAGSNPRARRPELVATSEIATMLTRRAWDRTGVKVSVFAWCIFWLVSVGWLAGRATFDQRGRRTAGPAGHRRGRRAVRGRRGLVDSSPAIDGRCGRDHRHRRHRKTLDPVVRRLAFPQWCSDIRIDRHSTADLPSWRTTGHSSGRPRSARPSRWPNS